MLVASATLAVAAMTATVSAAHPWADSPKRGVGMPLSQPDQAANLQKLDELDVPWFYSWSAEPRSGFDAVPDGTAFVPMSWGRNSPGLHASTWATESQAGRYDTLLGFNEPDLASQANMSVEEALALWPQLEATGLRLGSPAAANANNGWLAAFMAGAANLGLRVDFLAVHRYGNNDADAFLDHIDGLHAAYGLPIWITEFAVRDGGAATPADNRFTDQQIHNFMAEVLPALEARDHVERYAWFRSPRVNGFVTSSALFEEDGRLTKVGRLYRGLEEPAYDGGLYGDAGFEEAVIAYPEVEAPLDGAWVGINQADVSTLYANTGRQSLRLAPGQESGQSRPGIARQSFSIDSEVAPGGEYSLGAWVMHPSGDELTGTREGSLRLQWFDASGALLGDAREVIIDATSPTDEWFYASLDGVNLPDDPLIAELRATLWVNNVGPTSLNSGAVYFDDVALFAGPSALIPGDFNGDRRVDNEDLNLLLNAWGDSETPAGWAAPFDGAIDNEELNALLTGWGLGVAAVPEPDQGFLCVLMIGAMANFLGGRLRGVARLMSVD
ncbi:MAG: glycosyl hydrolase [Planctomycetota bacterium]